MSAQLPLLFVPRDHYTKRQQLDLFKTRWGIWTYRSHGMVREDKPWTALLMPPGTTPSNVWDLIASTCSLLEDSGLMCYGEGELSAVRELCQRNKIICNL